MTEKLGNELARMADVVRRFNAIAAAMIDTEIVLSGWLPARTAVEIVCGIDWNRLSHGTRTRIGAWLRDQFEECYPDCMLTPVRLLQKTNGKGSHMIAVYPPEWLVSRREALLELCGAASERQPFLFDDCGLDP